MEGSKRRGNVGKRKKERSRDKIDPSNVNPNLGVIFL